MKEDIVT